jgi:outer membrane protein assembly factor BamB/mono/diheme cytochrome c family protein
MKPRGRTLRSAGALLLFALLLTVVVAACGGGGSSSSTAEETTTTETTTTTEEETTTEPAEEEGGETAAWSLPNVNVQNTRAIESDITPENISTLKPAWAITVNGSGSFGNLSGGTVFNPDGKTVYVQALSGDVFAVDAESGEIEWEHSVPKGEEGVSGPNGVAYYEGDLYGETAQNAFALNAETGEKVWETSELAESKGQKFNIQPQPYEGKIFLSTSGQLHGGVAYALDAKTGKVLWEFEETKEPKERSAGGEAGTGGAWYSPGIGPEGEVFYGVGNPYRSIDQAINEPSKVLYNDSVVSLSQETGKLNWYMQPRQGINDFHDWDLNFSPIYVEETKEPMVIDGGKIGYIYSTNPKTGKLNWEIPVNKHNGHDLDSLKAYEGKFKKPPLPYRYWPGTVNGGGMAVAEGTVFETFGNLRSTFKGYEEQFAEIIPPAKATGDMAAVDLETGKLDWETKFPTAAFGAPAYSNGIVYTTLFGSEVVGIEAKTGKIVWKAKLPARSNASPTITGEYLIVPAGYPEGAGQKSQLVAFKLGATGKPAESVLGAGGGGKAENEESEGGGEEKETSGAAGGASATLTAGEEVFDGTCSTCHTLAAAGTNGTVGPNLDELEPSQGLVEHQVTNGGGGMPAFGSDLSKEEIKNVAQFVSHWAGKKLTPAQEKLAEENGSSAGGP